MADNNPPSLTFSMFSGPIPGQSLTHAPKSMPWQKPPQFVNIEEAMNFLMGQLTEPYHLKPLLAQMDAGQSLEAIARTILFTGFTQGKWTATLALLLYKPLMMSLIAIAHRAGMTDTPITMPQSMAKYSFNQMRSRVLTKALKGETVGTVTPKEAEKLVAETKPTAKGFMQRGVS